MKNLFLFSVFLLCSSFAWAATSTTRMGLVKPSDGETGWGETIRDNYDIIDSSVAILSSTQTFTGEVTFTSATFTNFRASTIFISSPSYSGSDKLAVNGDARFFGSTGGTIHICDQNALNCQTLSINTSNPDTGINVSTITVKKIDFNPELNSIFIGNGTGNNFIGNADATAHANVAIGPQALANITTGYHNIGIGEAALSSLTTSFANTAIGESAGYIFESGEQNIFIGMDSGSGLGSTEYQKFGDYNIWIGYFTGGVSSSTVLHNTAAIGPFAHVKSSNSMVLGVRLDDSGILDSDVLSYKVGIATDTPRERLHVVGNLRVDDGFIRYGTKTLAQIQAIANPSPVAGDSYYCSNCTTDAVCVSTGGVNSFVRVSARTTACQ